MVELATERLILRDVGEPDRDVIRAILCDPKVRRYLGGPVPDNRIDAAVDAYYCARDDERVWTAQLAESSTIGLVSLTPHTDGRDTEISYQFLPNFWGKGYASEAISGVLAHAQTDLNLGRVIAETQAENLASWRLLEKVGMWPERSVIRFGVEQIIYVRLTVP